MRGALVLGARYRRELIGEHAFAVVQQAPYERGLSVVDRARRNQAQDAGIGCDAPGFIYRIHQKYPIFFRRSIDASDVWSSMRVEPRSVKVERSEEKPYELQVTHAHHASR